ncbi:MAG: hypothetical protein HS102_07635 [Planctomycetia bacterium]|nr:hypothetical protein [Planctomycetia bacterium]
MAPAQIVFLVPQFSKPAWAEVVNSNILKDAIPSITRYFSPPPIRLVGFDHSGDHDETDGLPIGMVRIGMCKIFIERGGVMGPSHGYHYVKPSEKHCEIFLRSGNALVDSSEVDFFAYACLPYIPENIRTVYCDTGAILPVGYAIDRLRCAFGGPHIALRVVSFGSYEGLSKGFHFDDPKRSVILISASTSNDLKQRLLSHDPTIPVSNIVTLFYLGDSNDPRTICHLRHDHEYATGVYPVPSYSGVVNCPLCRSGSTPVALTHDQFLPEKLQVAEVILKREYEPRWLGTFMQHVCGTEIIRTNYRDPFGRTGSKDVFLDTEKAFGKDQLAKLPYYDRRLTWMTAQGFPAEACRILHLDDDGSRELALRVAEKVEAHGRSRPDVIALGEILEFPENHIREHGATVVVASAVVSGRSLLTASQVLRDIQPNRALVYLLGFARTQDDASFRDIKGNITHGERGDDYGFYLLDRLVLPIERWEAETAWDAESKLLRRILPFAEAGGEAERQITTRLDALEFSQKPEQKGLKDNLFWESSSGCHLRLRPGFTFCGQAGAEGKLNQAEVFCAIVGVLHHLRGLGGRSESLNHDIHVKRILSPRCFDRFNDGVVQAALLRAARPSELDFSVSTESSRLMRQILDYVLANSHRDAGEAAREFAIAIATERLRLRREDLVDVVKDHRSGNGDQVIAMIFNYTANSPQGY